LGTLFDIFGIFLHATHYFDVYLNKQTSNS